MDLNEIQQKIKDVEKKISDLEGKKLVLSSKRDDVDQKLDILKPQVLEKFGSLDIGYLLKQREDLLKEIEDFDLKEDKE